MAYDAGSAVASYRIDTAQAEQAATKIRQLWQGIAQAQAQAGKSSGGGNSVANQAADQQKAERAILARANAEARLAQVQNTGKNVLAGLTQAEKIYAEALKKVDQNSVAAIRTQGQLQVIQNRIAGQAGGGIPALPRTLEKFGTEAIEQFKSGLLGIVGPAAVATAAIGGITKAAQSFKEAFVFKAELDATNQAITTNIGKVRDSGIVFAQAQQFADKYRLTQRETADILASSTDTLRTSTASVGELESALLRLQSRDVSKPVSEAARALRELQSGDVTSIKELFNVPAREALRMRDEIVAGGDAVKVLNDYLNRAGVSMEVLNNRSKGVAGALNEQKIAAENLALAQANIASSAGGILFVQEQTRVYRGLANLLNGDVVAGYKATAAELSAAIVKNGAYNAAINAGKSEAEAAAIAEAAYAAQINIATKELNGGVGPNVAYANSLNLVADGARNAANELSKVTDQSKSNNGKRTIGPSASSGLLALAQGRQTTANDIAESQKRYNDLKRSELQIAYAKAKTDAERAAILRQELQYADSQIAKNGILAQIEGLKGSTAKKHTSELTKQLNLNESIFDSINKQRDAELSLLELKIRDRQDTRKENDELKAANAILNSPNASADLKARAQDRIDLINVNRAQRQQKIIEESATANATIKNGKLYQSIPNAGAGSPTTATGGTPIPNTPSTSSAPVAASGGSTGTVNVNVIIDGKVAWSGLAPYAWSELMQAVNSVKTTKGVG